MEKRIKLSFLLIIGMVVLVSLVSAIPNPAPIYCENMGYTINETHCIFDDGNSCEQWAFFNGDCGQEYVKVLDCVEEGVGLSPGYECCEGLIGRNPSTPIRDGICDEIAGSFGICIPCGNGVCDEELENICNCPEDCDTDDSNETDDNETEDNETDTDCWSCTKWSECIDGKQTRECTGTGNCTDEKPKEEKNCRVREQVENKTSQGIGQELVELIREAKREFKEGNFTGPQGQFMNVREIVRGLKELRVGKIVAQTRMNLTEETDEQGKKKLKVKLKNGKEFEIKIMPDTASERALERLRLKVCSEENNCTIELKETGKGDNAKPTYEVQVERHSRILGLFKKKMQVRAEVNAENGEVMKVRKPWWAFLASEPAEE